MESIVDRYLQKVRADHQSRVLRVWFLSYAWFWSHTEFWLATADRRPYTYIFRDWIFPHMRWFIVMVCTWYAGLLAWGHWSTYPPLVLGILSSLLVAHLVWGSKWIPDEKLQGGN